MKKIMFNDKYGLTKAVIEGRKTMTRRIINTSSRRKSNPSFDECERVEWGVDRDGEVYLTLYFNSHPAIDIFPAYQVGEVVAVAQSYNDIYEELKRTHGSSSYVTRQFFHKYIQGGRMQVSNKMFVASDACLHHIRITNVFFQQLQDITDWECLAEGIVRVDLQVVGHETLYSTNNNPVECEWYAESARTAYATLIDKISGKGTWYKNPYVFAYTFELIKKS